MGGRRVLVGTRKGLFTIELAAGGGEVVDVQFPGVPVSAVLDDARDGSRYVALDHGHFGCKVHRSDDRGSSYLEVAAPTYPPRPADATDVNPMSQEPIPWSTRLVWTLAAGHPDRPGTIWCGTIPGGLFRSNDRGDSWDLVRPLWDHPDRPRWFGGGYDLPGVHSILVDPRHADHLLVGVSVGGAWATTDDGASWAVSSHGMSADYLPAEQWQDPVVQDPHRIVRSAADPDRLWCQHHNGIYRSTDNASSWSAITGVTPSSFGFAVAVHPLDPETAWFVPAVADVERVPVDGALVMTRTRDGGATFDTLRDGLPQRHAYDLVYRHGLVVDETGERLVLGSTTGSLWTSSDGGDHFDTISNHLPMILCVAFANPD